MNAGITLKDLLAFGSIGAVVVGCAFFFGELSSRVDTLEKTTVTGERIARLEGQMGSLSDSNRELKTSIDTLAREIRRARSN